MYTSDNVFFFISMAMAGPIASFVCRHVYLIIFLLRCWQFSICIAPRESVSTASRK